MSNVRGEPIPGTGDPKIQFQQVGKIGIVAEISHLLELERYERKDGPWTRLTRDFYDKLHDKQRQLTDDIVGVLDEATSLSPGDKLQLGIVVISQVDWGKNRNAYPETVLARHEALNKFLQGIPDDVLDDISLNALLDANERVMLKEVRERVAQAVSKMPPEQGKKFLPRLTAVSQPTPSGYVTYDSEWAQVLSGWDPEEARPYVDELISQIDKSNLFQHPEHDVALIIEKWPVSLQYGVIRQALTTLDLEGLRSAQFFKLMKSWSPEEAMPLLQELLAIPLRPDIGVTYADRDFGSLAIAMSNWSSRQVNEFLQDDRNTRWIRDVVSELKKEKAYDYYFIGFKLSSLLNRDVSLDEEHAKWLVEGFKVGHHDLVVSIVKENPSMFTPELASLMFFVNDSNQKQVEELFSSLSKEQQIRYFPAITNLLMRKSTFNSDDSFDERALTSKIARDIMQKWTLEEQDRLLLELLSRGRQRIEEAVGSPSPRMSHNVITAFQWLQQRGTLTNTDIIKYVLMYSIGYPDTEEGRKASELIGKIGKNDETERLINEAAGDAIAIHFRNLTPDSAEAAFQLARKYSVDNDLRPYLKKLPTYILSLIPLFNITEMSELADFTDNQYDFVSFLSKSPDKPTSLTNTHLKYSVKLHLTLKELEELKRSRVALPSVREEDDFKRVFETLRRIDPAWQDEQNVASPFRLGAEVFGYERMFRYIDRRWQNSDIDETLWTQRISRHDALHTFNKVIDLYQSSGLSPDQFYGQILNQVLLDGALYNAGSAHQHFNEIAVTLDRNYRENLALAKRFFNIEGMGELVEAFSSPYQIFSNWNNLKRYSVLTQLLGEREVFERLRDIENPRLRAYVAQIAFHNDSKVDMQAAIEFATDPMRFLERGDDHAPIEVHDRKKPSNYIEIPNLDLTAMDLVEALVDGKMDTHSAFTPMEISYTVIVDEETSRPHELLKRALGSRAKADLAAIPGEARNSKKLFSEVGHLLKPAGLTVQQYLAGAVLPDKSRTEIEQRLFSLLFHEQFGMRKSAVKTQTYVAKIGRKSDPDMVLAGDDTVNCMPFGSGKNTVYTFNPNTAQFVLQVVKPDGKRRTIAQSVLTKDVDIQKSIPNVIEQLQEQGEHLVDVLPENILLRQPAYIACDNVEVSPNFTDQASLITALYRDFFRQYLARFADLQNLHNHAVVVGEGYSDALNELPEIPNTYAPQAPVSYSDKTHGNVRVLEMNRSDSFTILQRDVSEDELPAQPYEAAPAILGLELLTFQHALQVAFIEGKAYADNQSLIQYLWNMENGLIAKDINNAAKGRPNMSLAYRDKSGKMQGYLLAYEGKLSDQDARDYAEQYADHPFLYISDIASNVSAGGTNETGLSLLRGFIQLYKQHYIDKGSPIPIFAQMREETSYRIVQRGLLNRLVRDLGIMFEVEELPTYSAGSSTMHPVIIRPRTKQAARVNPDMENH